METRDRYQWDKNGQLYVNGRPFHIAKGLRRQDELLRLRVNEPYKYRHEQMTEIQAAIFCWGE